MNAKNEKVEVQVANDRESWLAEAAGLLLDERILPAANMDTPPPYRVAVGFGSGRASKALAVCYRRQVSTDGHNEIFVSPVQDDSVQILAALTHELIHALDDCESGHRGHFAHVARAVGLDGPLTATRPGPELAEYLQTVVDLLGPIPHAAMDLSKRPKQSTRMNKLHCVECGFVARASTRWTDMLPVPARCPLCTSIALTVV